MKQNLYSFGASIKKKKLERKIRKIILYINIIKANREYLEIIHVTHENHISIIGKCDLCYFFSNDEILDFNSSI